MSEADTHSTPAGDEADRDAIEAFIARWERSGGSEPANLQTFANELCDLFAVKRPEPSQTENELNDYVFERRVDFKFDDGSTSLRRIGLYKLRRCIQSLPNVCGHTSEAVAGQQLAADSFFVLARALGPNKAIHLSQFVDRDFRKVPIAPVA